jgi:hypothetical protein
VSSFFETYKAPAQGAGGKFLIAAEKKVLIDNGIPFQITSLQFDEHNEHGPRYIATVNVPNPETGEEEERRVGFPVGTNVQTRDSMLDAMSKYFDEGGDPVTVKLEQTQRAIFIVPAE